MRSSSTSKKSLCHSGRQSHDRRRALMDVIEQLDDPHVPIAQACEALGVSRATLYRQTRPAPPPAPPRPAPSPRRLSDPERKAVLDVLHSDEFVDQPPPEVYATLLSRGVYLASIRTMYRLLAASGESGERRAQRGPMKHAKPTLTATAPNQIWTWDITKLRGPLPGVIYCLYVVLDLFSRMTVGWLLAERESAELAEQLFAETVARHGVEPGSLTVHADRGSAMRSEGLAQLFGSLGVGRSFSRPHVSDDNAFSEAQFKTLKYQPDYPERFASLTHARAWCQEFFGWYNDLHQHSGLALFTPADVFYGRVEDIAARRQVALDAAYAAHPERFPNGRPVVRRPPASVAINPLSVDDAAGEAAAPTHPGTTSDAPEPGATPAAAARPLPLTSQSRNAPLCAIHS
ncbi:IS3 family transposase [Sorangium sp. So ce854]|uniref:IS3 family transposase n=1 Tax=Sorangium sp. So ce854 TaxID=3133322 RepID=UPI003F6098BF